MFKHGRLSRPPKPWLLQEWTQYLQPKRRIQMEGYIVKMIQAVFKLVITLMIGGAFVSAMIDIQKKAHYSLRTGLISMRQINEQLVGKTK